MATLSITFSGSFLWDLTYSTDVISYFGNTSQDKSASAQTPLKPTVYLHVIHMYLLANLQKELAQCLKSLRRGDIFCGFRQIWMQEQPTGVGFSC